MTCVNSLLRITCHRVAENPHLFLPSVVWWSKYIFTGKPNPNNFKYVISVEWQFSLYSMWTPEGPRDTVKRTRGQNYFYNTKMLFAFFTVLTSALKQKGQKQWRVNCWHLSRNQSSATNCHHVPHSHSQQNTIQVSFLNVLDEAVKTIDFLQ